MVLTLYPNKDAIINRAIKLELKEGLNIITIDNIPETINDHSLIFNFRNSQEAYVKSYEFVEKDNMILLDLEIISNQYNNYILDISYTIQEITKQTFYTIIYDPVTKQFSIAGWLEIQNQSGIDFNNIELRSISNEKNDNVIFNFDYFYNIENNQKIYVSFLSKENIIYSKKYRLPFNKNNISEYMIFNNTTENNLGIIFMNGIASIYQKTPDVLAYIGEENINMYAPEEQICLPINTAENKIAVTKSNADDVSIINLQNLTQEIVEIDVEINTFNKKIIKSNVVFDIDDNGIGYVTLTIMPLSEYKIIYQLDLNIGNLSENL